MDFLFDDEPTEKVRRFRERFAGVRAAERDDARRDAPTEEVRFEGALELHTLQLYMEIEQAMVRAGTERVADVVDEVNRRRLGRSPMPVPLVERLRELREGRSG